MNKGKIYGALIAGDASGSANQLIVVSSISDLSALDIAANFEEAAKKNGETDHTEQAVRANAARSQGPLRARLLTRSSFRSSWAGTWRRRC